MKGKLGNLYVEQQSFFTWWLVLLLLLIAGASCFAAWASLGSEASIAALVGVGVVFAVAILLFSTRLRSRIDEKGIHIKFGPFIIQEKTWRWEDIDEVYVRRYSLWDYGGWGYRLGANGTAYTTKGNYGIQLVLKKKGSRILVGTQNPEEVQRVLSQIKSSDHED